MRRGGGGQDKRGRGERRGKDGTRDERRGENRRRGKGKREEGEICCSLFFH